MKDIFNDPEFDRWLDGGVHDLDEDIGRLVYALYKKKIVDTTGCYSCSGHVGRSTNSGHSTRPDTHHVYDMGALRFRITEQNPLGERFVHDVERKVAQHIFARFAHPKKDSIYHSTYRLELEMNDLVDFKPHPGLSGEIPIPLAEARFKEFQKFWESLEHIAQDY
ncbi:MAG: hypothetical protein WCK90_05980 [archaeon]